MGKQRKAPTKFQKIRGVVSATEWDDDDRVVAAVLTTDDDEELLIHPSGRGEALLEYVDEYVEVKGVVQDDDGDYGLVVRNFKVLGHDDDEGEDEDGLYRGADDFALEDGVPAGDLDDELERGYGAKRGGLEDDGDEGDDADEGAEDEDEDGGRRRARR